MARPLSHRGYAVFVLWQAHGGRREVRFLWIVHRKCAVEIAEGAARRGDNRFGVANRGRTGPPRRRTFLLAEIVPRIHLRYDRSTDRCTHQQRQLEILWRSLNSDGEEVTNGDEDG